MSICHYAFKAVIFDLDGVVTRTASLHAQSWKEAFDEYLRIREERDDEPFREFTHQGDYLPYVDGKPRYEGVKSFLKSRGITLAFGEPSDSPDKETVCGLGNKKNQKFLHILKTKGAEVFPTSIEFIKALMAEGIRIGVASSSKNCKPILQSVGIEDLFQTRVDGVVSVQLGLKGKPNGDIFVTAAANLGAIPANSVVVEDASSGVAAGRNGGFGLVIGVARENNEDALLSNGADIVVGDLSEMSPAILEDWFHKKPVCLSQFWESASSPQDISQKDAKSRTTIRVNPYYLRSGKSALFDDRKPVFFLDYDGTLTPIVSRPELAVLSFETKEVLARLCKKATVAIVSGRAREDVEQLVGIGGIFYAGSHGFDIVGPSLSLIEPRAQEIVPLIFEITAQLKGSLGDIKGVLIEEKRFSAAVHYRLLENQEDLDRIKQFVDKIVERNAALRLMCGKKVFEILPAIDWDKGKAVCWIMQALGVSWLKESIVYIGDDTTDEDAFRTVRTRGTGILVSSESKESAADFRISSPKEVEELLKILSSTI